MSTVPPEGTPDPASEPLRPEPPVEPTTPTPPSTPPGYQPPGYQQPAYGQPGSTPPPYGEPGATPPPYGPGYGQPGYQQPGYDQTGYQQPGYQQPGYGQPAYGTAAPLSPSDERLWATLSHLGPIVLAFIAPLVIWFVFRERSRFVDDQAKEALNFQILMAIVYIVGGILTVALIGPLISFAGWVLTIVFGIQGAIAVNRGQTYRYPFNWRIVK